MKLLPLILSKAELLYKRIDLFVLRLIIAGRPAAPGKQDRHLFLLYRAMRLGAARSRPVDPGRIGIANDGPSFLLSDVIWSTG
ncbi:hypothetical protein ASG39_18425 [Rhizobium sp. Leaf371]|uniref:hypothetical protein n=1 Tax=Rhizobium sp. Leaf371 TaxID=1736355 RepID=UPI00071577A8|nr:hypothetical protein [Rhizobium sp. Leaf371]KQS59306.1 hypothetical protein ASG39_18425 [Rhizobium sp. Leaf371]